MKKLLLFLALIGIGIYSYKNIYQKSFSYSNPVHLDARIGLTIRQISRNIEMAIFVETSSQQHCAEKQQNYLSHLFKNCERCAVKSAECNAELSSHNKALFSDTHVDTTYLSFTKANNSVYIKSSYIRKHKMIRCCFRGRVWRARFITVMFF